jgi:putative protein-disulfide isomerase
MLPVVFYCYDAYCGWCYGFSPVMQQFALAYQDKLIFEVLSGGMIVNDPPRPISAMAGYISETYQTVEAATGIRFGEDFLWHIKNPEESDWLLNSEKAAVALCIAKAYAPDRQVAFAGDLQFALNYEGRDLTDDEAYRHLLPRYSIPPGEFYERLHSDTYREKARYEFALVKQLQVTGFPAVLIQETETKFYLVSAGYTDYHTLTKRVDHILADIRPLRE